MTSQEQYIARRYILSEMHSMMSDRDYNSFRYLQQSLLEYGFLGTSEWRNWSATSTTLENINIIVNTELNADVNIRAVIFFLASTIHPFIQ